MTLHLLSLASLVVSLDECLLLTFSCGEQKPQIGNEEKLNSMCFF